MWRIWTMMASACSRLLRSRVVRHTVLGGAGRATRSVGPLWPGGWSSRPAASEVLQTEAEIALPAMCASCAGYSSRSVGPRGRGD